MHRVVELLKRYPIAAVVFLGAVIRFIFLMEYLSSPEWDQLVVDSLFHDRWAQSIAAGNLFGREVFFRAPFYIYVLGGLYAVFGHSLLAARIFGHLVGLATVLITYRLASRVFSKRVGIIAGLIHALYPIAVYFESELLVDSLFAMLTELTVLLLFVAFDKRSIKLYFLAGIVIGMAAITRPIILALVPLYLIWLLIASKPFKTGLISGAVLTTSM
ncbi:MAG: glycosyltransferase family 39 protein, partial [Candidatus Zixiibacteriota bacterium]